MEVMFKIQTKKDKDGTLHDIVFRKVLGIWVEQSRHRTMEEAKDAVQKLVATTESTTIYFDSMGKRVI